MTTEELIKKSIFKIDVNGIYTQYLISSENSPMQEKDVCGCWLLVFNSKESMSTWLEIYNRMFKVINSNSELSKVVCFETIEKLDDFTLCQNRGFNEAYTTEHYAEFIENGDCKPNKWIVSHIEQLKNTLNQPFIFKFESENKRSIIDHLIEKALVKPNLDLKWTDEPFAWTLYLAPISESDINTWTE